jgi:hypothetical protein
MTAKTLNNGSAAASRLSVNKDGGLVAVQCTLTGVTPLLINAMPHDALLGLWTGNKPAKTAERPEPREWADAHLHKLPDGRPCVPPRMLYASLIGAGQFVRLDGKRQVSTGSSTTLPGLMTLTSFELPILKPGSDEAAPWEVDIQQGRNPNGGEAVCIIRPCFYAWQIHAELLVDRKTFPLESARGLVELAGRRMGLGDFRPNRKGMYGCFAITLWKPAD